MSASDHLYRPPEASHASQDASLSGAELRFVLKVFLFLWAGGSLVLGVVACLEAGYALDHFSMAWWVAGVVAVGALRLHGAGVVCSSAAMALVIVAHRRPTMVPALRGRGVVWGGLLSFPFLAFGAACLMIGAAAGAAALVFDVSVHRSWDRVEHLTAPVDPLVGAGFAAFFGLLLVGAAPLVGRLLSRVSRRLLVKVVLALILSRATVAMANAAVSLALSE